MAECLTKTVLLAELAIGGSKDVSPNECYLLKKPKVIKPCNPKPCRISLHRNFNSELPRKSKRNNNVVLPKQEQVTLKVEGKATVFEGSLVKLRCPEWKIGKDDLEPVISWSKGTERIVEGNRYHFIRNVLKIRRVQLSDSAVFKCWSDQNDLYHTMFLHVLAKPANTSQDINNLVLSDYSNQLELPSKQYYKNELDLSQEVHKFSHRDTKKPRHELAHFGMNPMKSHHRLNGQTSREVTDDRVQSNELNGGEQMQTWSELDPDLESKGNILSRIDETNLDHLKFNWITTEWSKCTIPCGGIGFKVSHSCALLTLTAFIV